jgi:hypothetical protein
VPIEAVARGAGCRKGFAGFGECSRVRRFLLRGRRSLGQNLGRANEQRRRAKRCRQGWTAKTGHNRPDRPANSAIHSAIIAQKLRFGSPQNFIATIFF